MLDSLLERAPAEDRELPLAREYLPLPDGMDSALDLDDLLLPDARGSPLLTPLLLPELLETLTGIIPGGRTAGGRRAGGSGR